MLLLSALDFAFNKAKLEPHTKECVASCLRYVFPAIRKLEFHKLKIHLVTRKHIRMIMDQVEYDRKLSARSWNSYRTYLGILFEVLYEYEKIQVNCVLQLKKQEEDEVIREVLSIEDRRKLLEHLQETDPIFLRFIQIFFHSGARRSELLSLKIENVNLNKGYYQVYVKKGRKKRWVTKVIKDIALPYWANQIGNKLTGYVFSVGLLPGKDPIRPEQVTRRWKRHVKDKLGITADLYSLKHLNTDEMSDKLSLMEAAQHNSHTVQMARKHYAVNETLREMDRVRKLRNQL